MLISSGETNMLSVQPVSLFACQVDVVHPWAGCASSLAEAALNVRFFCMRKRFEPFDSPPALNFKDCKHNSMLELSAGASWEASRPVLAAEVLLH